MFTNKFVHPFFGRGFRPFFLLGALYSIISLVIWGGFYAGHVTPPDFMGDPVSWHAHEMIFGFAMAIIAGFLLTAVANWTGSVPRQYFHLASLCLLWIMGRIVMNFECDIPLILKKTIELSFIPALIISLSIPLLKKRNKRNFIFLGLLTALFTCNFVFLNTEDRTALYVAVMIIIMMISLIGGRIIPAFTTSTLRRLGIEFKQIPDQMALDIAALISLISIIFTLIFIGTEGYILAVLSGISAIIHVLRMRHYRTLLILNDPMTWILHAGYAWVILGLIFFSLSALNIVSFSTALHALTAGAIGSMTLGMMCRVALGHTGRALIACRLTTLSFALMQLAGIIRLFGPLAFAEYTTIWIVLSSSLWALCFMAYIIRYAPFLLTARPDGKPS